MGNARNARKALAGPNGRRYVCQYCYRQHISNREKMKCIEVLCVYTKD